MKKIVVVSGGFDPIHSGHIQLLREAADLGDMLIVGINSDAWLTRKKGKPFMSIDERAAILKSIRYVDAVWEFNDSDGTACALLEHIKRYYWATGQYEIIFANGGDRNETNNAEANVSGIKFAYGVGGNYKKNSSSWILRSWNESSSGDTDNRSKNT